MANRLTGGVDEFFSRTDSTGSFAQLTDALGSVIALTDSWGTLQTQYTYEPFGYTTAIHHGTQFWRLNRPWFRSILSPCQMSSRM